MDVYWMEKTLADLPVGDDWLSEPEAIRLERLRFPKRRADWLLGRWTAKQLVAKYLEYPDDNQAFREIEIRPAPSGAPEVFIHHQRARLAISLSHRNGTAICALAEDFVPLGCDLELVEPHTTAFIADYFTPREQGIISESGDRDLFSSLLWSAKESALKALGTGLRADTRGVDVRFEPPPFRRGTWGWLQIRRISGQMFQGWWQRSGDLIMTLVADPPPCLPAALRNGRTVGCQVLSVPLGC